jgi:hypothetical protein
MGRDLRLGLKMLWNGRAYATTAIVTLAVCIGANAAIFTLVNSVLLKPLPVPDAGRILLMSNKFPNAGFSEASTNSAVPDYFDRLHDVTVLEEQAMYAGRNLAVAFDGSPQLVHGMAATPTLREPPREMAMTLSMMTNRPASSTITGAATPRTGRDV